jgi:glucuronoarabinoxylan endo-1,4-beta-xylanase
VESSSPATYELSQNYPNPFNPSTLIRYQIPANSNVSLKVYNSTGKEVAQLVNGNVAAGVHEVSLNATHLSSGVYYYVIRAGNNFVETKKMMLLK